LPFVTDEFMHVSNGWRGEQATARLTRLCAEEDVPLVVRDPNADSALMGRQGIGTFIDLLAECATADLGILYEPRDQLAIGYIARTALYDQPSPTLSYGTHIAEPFDPVDDDQQLQNRVTVNRPGGSSATAQQDTGPLSVLPPPAGVGVYEASADANVYTDDQLPDVAGWLVHLGTLDALRYPQITLKLNNSAFTASAALTATAAGLDIGRQLTVDSLPSWLPPNPAETLIQGYTERITPHDWDLTFNTTPGELWDVAHADSARVDTDGSTLAVDATTTATSLSVASVAGGVLWTLTAASWPFSIDMGGEKLTVTAVSGTTSPQTLTVTRSVNGVVKSHLAGTAIRLWTRSYVAL
jgi:hypothetical protein